MNGWSYWKRLTARCLVGSLALALGHLNSAQAQYPESLPPYTNVARPVQAVPANLSGDQATAQKDERPKETGKTETPPPVPMAIAPVEAAPACSTCAPSSRHGLFGGFHRGGGGCSSGSCSTGSCGSGGCGSGSCGAGGCNSCGYNGCFPGHNNCDPCESCGPLGRFFCCFYECLCCPDPCYDPVYRVEANSAFWVDGARPVTMTRIRWDSAHNFTEPDRSEFLWGRIGGKGPKLAERSVKYNSLTMYQEVATKKASFFIEQDYRTVDPDVNNHTSGFGDMNLGTKALLFDCELLQVTFQFRTFVPIGNSLKGLGTGHVSLEPSLLFALKLLPETYLQGQLSEWIPIAGDPNSAGACLHYHLAINHVLWRIMPSMPLIGGLETNVYSFQDGEFTLPNGTPQLSSGGSWWNAGPSLRVSVCNKLDFGFSAMFNLDQHGPEQIYRSEFRFRF